MLKIMLRSTYRRMVDEMEAAEKRIRILEKQLNLSRRNDTKKDPVTGRFTRQ